MYDVAVVEAGPAGSTAARELSIKGYRVLLIDKAGFPRNKTCGGLISLKTINALDYEITSKVIENRITEVLLFGHDLKSIKVASGTLLGCTCQRIHFDSFLMEKAKKSGAVFRDNCELKSIENQDKSMIIKTNRGNFKTRYVIGADGVFSKTAKVTSLRKKWSKWQLGITLSVNIPLKGNELFDANAVEFFCIPILGGFGWCFPFKQHINVGIGCSAIKTTKALRFFDDLLNKIVRLKNLSKDEKKIKGSYLPAGGVNTLFASNGVILIGDAGGFVDPFSGEGIFGAVESGKLAARCIDNFYQGKAELPEKSFTRAACNLFITEFRYSLVLACILGGKGFWFNLIKKNRQLGNIFSNVMTSHEVYKLYLKNLLLQLPSTVK